MGISRDRLTYLFRCYYEGRATTAETNELMTWVRKGKNDAQLSSLIKESWDLLEEDSKAFSRQTSKQIMDRIIPGAYDDLPVRENSESYHVKPLLWRRLSIAAAAALLCISGAYWIWSAGLLKNQGQIDVAQTEIQPGTNKAMLTLGDGSVIELDGSGEGLLTRQGTVEISKTHDGQLIYQKAGKIVDNPPVNTVTTPRGGQYQITLPDNSQVWLNASSSIRFPASFANDERRVEVTGEVYFEVSKDSKRPFRAIFGNHEIEVLGTSFNINDYGDETGSQATLVEGKVLLKSPGKESKLLPGQGAFIGRDGTTEIKTVDIEEITAWKDGLFYFQDAGIEQVMRQVARWYDIEIGYEGVLPEKLFSGKVRRDVNLAEFMSMLRYLGVNYRVDGRKMIITDQSTYSYNSNGFRTLEKADFIKIFSHPLTS